jgi:hypothetical protein
MEIFTTANNNKKKLVSFPFSRGLNCLYLFKITKTAISQNFQWLKEKYLPLLRQKLHKRTSGFGIFTSKRTLKQNIPSFFLIKEKVFLTAFFFLNCIYFSLSFMD